MGNWQVQGGQQLNNNKNNHKNGFLFTFNGVELGAKCGHIEPPIPDKSESCKTEG